MMHFEWYAVCNFVVFSIVDICLDYGGVYVMFVLICALFMVLGFVLIYCGVVCVVECCFFLSSGCYYVVYM